MDEIDFSLLLRDLGTLALLVDLFSVLLVRKKG